ncbi:hypothetical protein [Amycolatopsis kentuckyensis]|uniref:hypothetical protein n=1 Tax=Amycolatopsis kentuckyensis TaxID=218823 RepID=UPI003565A540
MEPSDLDETVLRLAAMAYLGRYTGASRTHSASDLRIFFTWCHERELAPLAAVRALDAGGATIQTCVIDTVLEHSLAEYVRRPMVPNESPTLGLSHLKFEALLSAARESVYPFDFALVAMLGLLGFRVFEACAADISDIGEEHGHRALRVVDKGGKVVLVPLPPAVGRAIDRAVSDREHGPVLLNR